MVRDFRIGILQYLRTIGPDAGLTDIKTPFTGDLDTMEKRKNYKRALDTLSTEKLIIVNGSYDFLNWKLVNSLYPIDDKVIEVRITPKGMAYEQPPIPVVVEHVPEEPLNIPLPPAVSALKRVFTPNEETKERLIIKMRKMGATEKHLDINLDDDVKQPPKHKTAHAPIVGNPFTDAVALNDLDTLATIQLRGGEEEPVFRPMSVYLKLLIALLCFVLIAGVVWIVHKNAA